jgi:hypothetical protein
MSTAMPGLALILNPSSVLPVQFSSTTVTLAHANSAFRCPEILNNPRRFSATSITREDLKGFFTTTVITNVVGFNERHAPRLP